LRRKNVMKKLKISLPDRKLSNKLSAKRGPKPQFLKIEGNWEEAVTMSFKKKKPAGGWPR
jgi:hypothetical protein